MTQLVELSAHHHSVSHSERERRRKVCGQVRVSEGGYIWKYDAVMKQEHVRSDVDRVE